MAYREAKLAQLKPLVLDNPTNLSKEEENKVGMSETSSERVAPKNPRWAVYGKGCDDVAEFFNSGKHEPGDNKYEEEKVLLSKRIPDLAAATSEGWTPLHVAVQAKRHNHGGSS